MSAYLTEKKLGEVLQGNFSDITPQFQLGKYRCDYYVADINTIVEFDGPSHFTSNVTQVRDNHKNMLAKQNNHIMVRIPYFIQLTPQMFEFWFNTPMHQDTIYEYPHGFIDKKVIYPIDYNRLGMKKYRGILESMPDDVKTSIQLTSNEHIGEDDAVLFWKEYQRLNGTFIDTYEDYCCFLDTFYSLTCARIGGYTPFSSDIGFDAFIGLFMSYGHEALGLSDSITIDKEFEIFFDSLNNICEYT